MNSPKLWWLLAPILAVPGPASQEVRIELREGLEYEMHQVLRTQGSYSGRMEVEGEEYELEQEFLELLDSAEVLELSVRDELLELEDGRALRVRREYTRLEQRATEQGEEVERTGVLVGEPLELQVEEGGTVRARVLDGAQDVEEKFLVNHSLHEFFLPLLPSEAVQPGDAWELDEAAALDFSIRHDPHYFELPPELEPDGPYVDALRAAAECTVEVTFEGSIERDEVECLVLAYVCELECEDVDLPEDPEAEEGEEMSGSVSTSMTFTGRLWIDAESSFPLAMEVSLEGTESSELEWTEEDTLFEMALSGEVEGSVEVEWEIVESGR